MSGAANRLGRKRPQSAGSARSKPSWDGTNHDLAQFRLSRDDLRVKLQSRKPKPLEEYPGPPNVVRKQRPDGTEYVVGVRQPLHAEENVNARQQEQQKEQNGNDSGGDEIASNSFSFDEEPSEEAEAPLMPITITTLAPGVSYHEQELAYPTLPPAPPSQRQSWHVKDAFTPSAAAAAAATTTAAARQPDVQGPAIVRPQGRLSLGAQRVAAVGAAASGAGAGAASRKQISDVKVAATRELLHGDAAAQRKPFMAMGAMGTSGVTVENSEVEMANLKDACEELRTRIVKYELATNRSDKVEPLWRRPVAQGYTEFVLKASARMFEYLRESDDARDMLAKQVAQAQETASLAVSMVHTLQTQLETMSYAMEKRIQEVEVKAATKTEEMEEGQKRLRRQIAFLERSLEFQSVTSVLSSAHSGKQPSSTASTVPYPRPTAVQQAPIVSSLSSSSSYLGSFDKENRSGEGKDDDHTTRDVLGGFSKALREAQHVHDDHDADARGAVPQPHSALPQWIDSLKQTDVIQQVLNERHSELMLPRNMGRLSPVKESPLEQGSTEFQDLDKKQKVRPSKPEGMRNGGTTLGAAYTLRDNNNRNAAAAAAAAASAVGNATAALSKPGTRRLAPGRLQEQRGPRAVVL